MKTFRIMLVALGLLQSGLLAQNALTLADVQKIIGQAITGATGAERHAVIAVVDREGFVLGAWSVDGTQPSAGMVAAAIDRAGTAAFLSSDQNAFTSRTAGYIIQQHFPVGVADTAPGPLVGVGFSSLFFSDINRFKGIPAGFNALNIGPTATAPGDATTNPRVISPGVAGNQVALSTLDDSPGGVPLYKNGHLVGGLGVTGDGVPTNLCDAAAIIAGQVQRLSTPGFVVGDDLDEDMALLGQNGYRPSSSITADKVLINGIRIPYVNPTTLPTPGTPAPLGTIGVAVTGYAPQGSPIPFPYANATLGGVSGQIREPIRNDPLIGTIDGASRLTASEVTGIITLAAQRCAQTQAGIRLPLGSTAAVFICVVSNPHANAVPPPVLGCFRVAEATVFSWDVAIQKARTAIFFSNDQLAQSARTVGFLAQRYFPPGIDGNPSGPYFGFQDAVSLKTSPVGSGLPPYPGNPNLPNGITIFPGGFPLYRNGHLIGAIGVSGDGVDQDDIISASGCANFLAPSNITADNYTYQGVRLPYAKFPRNPTPGP